MHTIDLSQLDRHYGVAHLFLAYSWDLCPVFRVLFLGHKR